jgi:hypothetical protein
VRRNRFEIFEIPTEQGVVRIWLNDGGMQVEDASGETYADGWATVEDIASELSARIHLPPDEARSVALEAVRQWEERLGDRPHRFPRPAS